MSDFIAWLKNFPTRAAFAFLGWLALLTSLVGVVSYFLWRHWTPLSGFLAENPLFTIALMALATAAIGRLLEGGRAEERDVMMIILIMSFAVAAGLFLIAAIQPLAAPAEKAAAARVAAMWAGAYCAAGFFVGFLFGIPRVLQGDEPVRMGEAYVQRVNTNLEQISDWLTKIIVGLGLVELRKVPDLLARAAEWMAQSFTPAPSVQLAQVASVSTSIIIIYTIVGFLTGYLVTRLYLSGAFRRADQAGPDGSVRAAGGKSDAGVSKDSATTKLRKFWKPDGRTVNAVNEKALLDWMQSVGLISPSKQTSLPNFLNVADYATDRERAVKELDLK